MSLDSSVNGKSRRPEALDRFIVRVENIVEAKEQFNRLEYLIKSGGVEYSVAIQGYRCWCPIQPVEVLSLSDIDQGKVYICPGQESPIQPGCEFILRAP